MSSIINKAQRYARKSAAEKLDETVDNALNKLPDIPVVAPMVNKVAQEAKKQANKKLRKTRTDTDTLIIGAGMSGILMAKKIKESRPLDSIMIVEKRKDIGGTWDLFKYPGIRSDSEITTFCFADQPWYGSSTLANGKDIKSYMQKTVADADIRKHIRFETVVKELHWSSIDKMWTLIIRDLANKITEEISAKFVVVASGYYNVDKGYQPDFAGQNDYTGQIVHPQRWRDDIDYQDKKIVIIGSGATAVTLLPALLDKTLTQHAKHVTMLQRTPSYIASIPSATRLVDKLTDDWNLLSKDNAYLVNRWRAILTQQASYYAFKTQPRLAKALLTYGVKHELKNTDIDLKHFVPDYAPWDQRICATPNNEFFDALKTGNAEVVTDEIYCFTKNGIQLTSGKHLAADIIVTATGLNIQMLGGARVFVDGEEISIGDKMTYKAVMMEDIPNLAVMFGYINASWTLKVDIATEYVIRLMNYLSKHKYKMVVAHAHGESDNIRTGDNVMSALNSGYIHRGEQLLPRQGSCYPWYVTNNYFSDRKLFLKGKIEDDWLLFE